MEETNRGRFAPGIRDAGNRLWAITSYFPGDDPPGEKRRLAVYREFRRHLNVPLVTAELSFTGQFDLRDEDADILIRLRGESLLWQKERMLNIAFEAVPQSAEVIAWLDCDVVFTRSDWANAACRELEHQVLVQPFLRAYELSQQGLASDPARSTPVATRYSAAYCRAECALPDSIFSTQGASQRFGYNPGLAWAARRETLERHGLYDAMILGGGDKLLFSAALDHARDCASGFRLNPKHQKHVERWAGPFFNTVQGRVGYLDGTLLHLWHGDVAARRYKDRYTELETQGFDPHTDLARNRDDVWRWRSDKPEFEAITRRFFERRWKSDATQNALASFAGT